MIPSSVTYFILLTMLLQIAMPVVLLLWLRKRLGFRGAAVSAGVLAFFVMQSVLRVNLLTLANSQPSVQAFSQTHFLLYLLIVAFSAGLFEEFGRYFTMRLFLKNDYRWANGVGHGIGHGGMECWFMAIAMVNNLALVSTINSIGPNALIAQAPSAASAVQALLSTPGPFFLVSALERALTLPVQILLSVLVMEAMRRRKPLYFLIALAVHTAIDFGVVLLASAPLPNMGSVVLAEAALALCAAAAVFFILRLRPKPGDDDAPAAPPAPCAGASAAPLPPLQ